MVQERLSFEVPDESSKIWVAASLAMEHLGRYGLGLCRLAEKTSLENARNKITYVNLLWHCVCVHYNNYRMMYRVLHAL